MRNKTLLGRTPAALIGRLRPGPESGRAARYRRALRDLRLKELNGGLHRAGHDLEDVARLFHEAAGTAFRLWLNASGPMGWRPEYAQKMRRHATTCLLQTEHALLDLADFARLARKELESPHE